MLRYASCFLVIMAVYLQSFAMMSDSHEQKMAAQNVGQEKFFNQNNTINPEFQRLFEILATPEVPNTLEEAFSLVQGKSHKEYSWLRTGERYDAQSDHLLTEKQANAVIDFCKAIGFFDDIAIPLNINGILVMGSTLQRMRAQIQTLNHAIENNPALGALPVYFVGGERVLSKEIGETQQNLYHPEDRLTTFKQEYIPAETPPEINDERDMIKLVVNQSLSDKFKNIVFVMAPKKGDAIRATTMDGMKLWFNDHNPPGGHYALVSSNPFILYQQLVATDAALISKRPDISFSGYGTSISLEYYLSAKGKSYVAQILLDNFARIIYEIRQIQNTRRTKIFNHD